MVRSCIHAVAQYPKYTREILVPLLPNNNPDLDLKE
jgi:hypothetical protein